MIPSLIYLDRYRNEGTRTYSSHADYSEAEERFRPETGVEHFPVPAYFVPREEVNLYLADPHPRLLSLFSRGGEVVFCVHPQLSARPGVDPYLDRLLSLPEAPGIIEASPSSSTRTVFVKDSEPPHALKLHFPFRVSRYGRRMRDEVVEQAVTVSRELEEGIRAMDPDFAFLREVLGVTFKNLQPETPRGENWGFLVRELTPFPSAGAEGALVPGFALYGRDFLEPSADRLIHTLVGEQDPNAFLLNQIMLPIVRHWVTCFLKFGLLLEPHGQNVLLEMGPDGTVDRIVHRDLNLGIDNRRRTDLGLSVGGTNTYNQMETGEFCSITYDKFMGGHFFDYLAACAVERYSTLDLAGLREACREEFLRLFPHHEEYLPRTVQYFSETRDRFGKPTFMDTGKAPEWRP